MALDDIKAELEQRFSTAPPLGKVVGFDFGADGGLSVDGTGSSNMLGSATGNADCTLQLSTDTLRKILDGSVSPTSAFMTGKLKIQGDMGVAMKLASALG